MREKYILALDQGTTSSRAIIFGHGGWAVHSVSKEFRQIYPKPGWVEHDPMEILHSQIDAATIALKQSGVGPEQIAAIGITNQRETAVVWDRETGKPLHNAVVWQCRRTADYCDALSREGFDEEIRNRTGLVCDAYFSGTKFAWLLDNVPKLRDKAEKGEAMFGTVDSWLLYHLTGGRVHATDVSNASRTLLYNIHERKWDETVIKRLGIPRAMLPEVLPSSHIYGETDPSIFGGVSIPIAGIAGDQQAALFGQACFEPGMTKVTYGTGAFLLMNTGKEAFASEKGLLTSVAWGLGDEITYCLEGSIFIAGAAVQWLRDGLGLIGTAEESELLAQSVPDNGGVYFVPALVGLGAPVLGHARPGNDHRTDSRQLQGPYRSGRS